MGMGVYDIRLSQEMPDSLSVNFTNSDTRKGTSVASVPQTCLIPELCPIRVSVNTLPFSTRIFADYAGSG